MSELAFCINPDSDSSAIGQNLDMLLDRGVSCVGANELDAVEYFDRDIPDAHVIESFARQVEHRQMKVVTVHGVGGFVAIDPHHQHRAIDHLRREVDRTAAWSCPCLVFHFRQPAMRWTKSEMADWTVEIVKMGLETFDAIFHETLAQVCEYAAARNVGLYLEAMGPPFSYGNAVHQIVPALDLVNRSNLGVCVDTGHLYLSGHDPAGQIRLTHGRPLTLHLNDNIGPIPPNYDIYDSDLHLVPGLGTINWVQVILALREVGYNGPFIFEGPHYPGSTFEDAVRMTIHNWHVLEQLANQIEPARLQP